MTTPDEYAEIVRQSKETLARTEELRRQTPITDDLRRVYEKRLGLERVEDEDDRIRSSIHDHEHKLKELRNAESEWARNKQIADKFDRDRHSLSPIEHAHWVSFGRELSGPEREYLELGWTGKAVNRELDQIRENIEDQRRAIDREEQALVAQQPVLIQGKAPFQSPVSSPREEKGMPALDLARPFSGVQKGAFRKGLSSPGKTLTRPGTPDVTKSFAFMLPPSPIAKKAPKRKLKVSKLVLPSFTSQLAVDPLAAKQPPPRSRGRTPYQYPVHQPSRFIRDRDPGRLWENEWRAHTGFGSKFGWGELQYMTGQEQVYKKKPTRYRFIWPVTRISVPN